MKLKEFFNKIGKGDATNLTGGKLPNAYEDDFTKLSKKPRVKKKDVYGVDLTGAVDGGGDAA